MELLTIGEWEPSKNEPSLMQAQISHTDDMGRDRAKTLKCSLSILSKIRENGFDDKDFFAMNDVIDKIIRQHEKLIKGFSELDWNVLVQESVVNEFIVKYKD